VNQRLTYENVRDHNKAWNRVDKQRGDDHYKVKKFILDNPISSAFLRREKGKLPYSVFKSTADDIRFQKSGFKGRPPTVFFPYPGYVNAK